ncbi:MAG: hypothetical protein FD125_2654 [bacterium]|nr:MAG: hypothetical protein FD125_2654 [bacterium]
MQSLFQLVLAALFSLTAASSSAQSTRPPFQMERTDRGLMFVGQISPQSVLALEEELREDDLLIFASSGGERHSAERLADLLVERKVRIIVNGSCFSACALHVALGAPRVEVPEGAIVLFHSDTAMWIRALAEHPDRFSEADRAEIGRAHAAQIRILQRQGINPDILWCIARAIGPRYAEMRRTPPAPAGSMSTHDVRFAIPTDFDFVWLSPAVLEHFGARNVDVRWSLNEGGRQSYPSYTGKRIVWVDTVEQCQ